MQQTTGRDRAPSLFRRIGALLYDGLLLVALLMIALVPVVVGYDIFTGKPIPQDPVHRTLIQAYLLSVVVAFYVYFWTRGGQTLGMRAWGMRLVRADGAGLERADALRRLGWAAVSLLPLGLGLVWCLFDREGLSWHDRMSSTRLELEKR